MGEQMPVTPLTDAIEMPRSGRVGPYSIGWHAGHVDEVITIRHEHGAASINVGGLKDALNAIVRLVGRDRMMELLDGN